MIVRVIPWSIKYMIIIMNIYIQKLYSIENLYRNLRNREYSLFEYVQFI